MTRGLVKCKREGCDKMSHTRGMCKSHYNRWYEQNPEAAKLPDTPQMVLDAMPGTLEALAADVGIGKEHLRRIVKRLRADDKCFIGDYRQPLNVRGSCWVPIFHAGKGVDVVIAPEVKAERTAERARVRCSQNYYKRTTGNPTKPPKFSALLAALGA